MLLDDNQQLHATFLEFEIHLANKPSKGSSERTFTQFLSFISIKNINKFQKTSLTALSHIS